jgi:GNAT superfamily N-acetyltransferase
MLITIPVRKAKPRDREAILKICEQNHSENGQGAIIGVVGRDRIEGLIMLLIAQFWYTEDWCLEEIMNFVLPDHRRSTHAKDLIAFAKRCSEEIGIPLVIGVVANERTKAKMELYRRQLGDPCGGYFLHRPAHPLVQNS